MLTNGPPNVPGPLGLKMKTNKQKSKKQPINRTKPPNHPNNKF